ncbi:DUF6894 family protein [Bradyrhizobium genosp. P]|uniref:DUF6894 family protein n=1 Tax=Bradyrhizobium genosp. P TaxID=83641 RepID=UPI003CE8E93D
MPLYFFHLQFGNELSITEDAIELSNLSEAEHEAEGGMRDLLIEAIRFGKERLPDAFIIADGSGKSLLRVSLSSILPEPLKIPIARGPSRPSFWRPFSQSGRP